MYPGQYNDHNFNLHSELTFQLSKPRSVLLSSSPSYRTMMYVCPPGLEQMEAEEKKRADKCFVINTIESWQGFLWDWNLSFKSQSGVGWILMALQCPQPRLSLGSISMHLPWRRAVHLCFGSFLLSSLTLGIRWYLELLSDWTVHPSERGLWDKDRRLTQVCEWEKYIAFSFFPHPPPLAAISWKLVVLNTTMFCFVTRQQNNYNFASLYCSGKG